MLEFLKLLATAHQCTTEKKIHEGEESIFYQGPSPDEVTLVEFAQQHGYEFFFSNDSVVNVRVQTPRERDPEMNFAILSWKVETEIEFEVIRRMDFNSDRKRMSILVFDPSDGYYKLYCKGADSIIKDRLDQDQVD